MKRGRGRPPGPGQKTFTNREKILVNASVDHNTGCWVWLRQVDKHGYGLVRDESRRAYAHRLAYRAFVGPITDGLHCLHTCDNPPCVNPGHLFLGTHDDNMRDRGSKGRSTPPTGSHLNFELAKAARFARALSGASYASVGRALGVTQATASLACKGLTYRWPEQNGNGRKNHLSGYDKDGARTSRGPTPRSTEARDYDLHSLSSRSRNDLRTRPAAPTV